jgi:hypothetical protein
MVQITVEPRLELRPDVGPRDLADVALGRDDEVEGPPARRARLREATKDLSEPALEAVADNGVADLSRDGEPEADERPAVGQELQDQVVAVDTDTLMLDTEKFPALAEAARLREGLLEDPRAASRRP